MTFSARVSGCSENNLTKFQAHSCDSLEVIIIGKKGFVPSEVVRKKTFIVSRIPFFVFQLTRVLKSGIYPQVLHQSQNMNLNYI